MFATLILACCCLSEIELQEGTTVQFASQKKAEELLGTSDEFTRALSPFDKQSRMHKKGDISEAEYLKFAQAEALSWEENDRESLTVVMQSIARRLEKAELLFPKTIWLVCTSGAEEGNAAYTRGNAIMMPRNTLNKDRKDLERLLLHELFHVFSRHDKRLRLKLYELIGFRPLKGFTYPAFLANRRITNPDSPDVAYGISLKIGKDQELIAAPITYAASSDYDPEKDGSFFKQLMFRMLVVEEGDDGWRAVLKDGRPVVFDVRKAPAFFEKVGRNTNYIIHPEEILADNFALLMMQETGETPELLKKVGSIVMKR